MRPWGVSVGGRKDKQRAAEVEDLVKNLALSQIIVFLANILVACFLCFLEVFATTSASF